MVHETWKDVIYLTRGRCCSDLMVPHERGDTMDGFISYRGPSPMRGNSHVWVPLSSGGSTPLTLARDDRAAQIAPNPINVG
jgi:hypothetical protein